MVVRSFVAGSVLCILATGAFADELPAACKVPVTVPAVFETATEQVLDQPERTEIRTQPAQYIAEAAEFEVKPPEIHYEIVPAVYETVTEQVLIKPERTETVVIPAEYESFTEQILVRPAYITWELKAEFVGKQLDEQTDLSLDRMSYFDPVEIPAEYQSVTRTRIVTPERSETRIIPALFQTLVKQVLVQPAEIKEIQVPAEYETVVVQKQAQPASEEFVSIPATYRTIEKQVTIRDATVEWRAAPCADQLSAESIKRLQSALEAEGFPIEIDGVMGRSSLIALRDFQRQSGLAEGQITFESLDALGVQLTQ